MADPTELFFLINNNTLTTELDTVAERKTFTDGTIDSLGSNPQDFGTVDISGGTADSRVETMGLRFSANGGNTTIDDGRLWLSSSGLDQAGSNAVLQPLSGADEATPTNTKNYFADAVKTDYDTWSVDPLDETLPASNNLWAAGPDDTVTTIDITTVPSDCYMWASYFTVDGAEDSGTYEGVSVTNFELRYSCRISFS